MDPNASDFVGPAHPELARLVAECEHLRRERDIAQSELDRLRSSVDKHTSAELRLLAATLTKEVKQDFMESVKRGLWVAALLASVATAGGVITLSDILKDRIDAAVEGKHNEIEELRKGVVGALADVRVQAATARKEVEALKVETAKAFETHAHQVAVESENALTKIRGLSVQVTSTVDASGRPATSVSATVKSPGNQVPSPADDQFWFGQLPKGVVGIAGAGFNQVGKEEAFQGVTRGAFSYWFQKGLVEPTADRNSDGAISLNEAFERAAAQLKSKQNPVIAGENRDAALFSVRDLDPTTRPKRTVHAVLVGINEYQGVPSLRGPVPDVESFGKLLNDKSRLLATDVRIKMLTNSEATRGAIISALEQAASSASPSDVLIFYFAGHGTHVRNLASDTPPSVRVLGPYDLTSGNLLFVTDITAILRRTRAGQSIFIADV